jgi:hypothetical protein
VVLWVVTKELTLVVPYMATVSTKKCGISNYVPIASVRSSRKRKLKLTWDSRGRHP